MEESSLKTTVIYVALSIAISVGGIYWMVEPINRKANTAVEAGLKKPQAGPFDESLAKSFQMEDLLENKAKWTPSFIKTEPIGADLDWLENRRSNDSVFD